MARSKAGTYTSDTDITPELIGTVSQALDPLMRRAQRWQFDMSTVTEDLSTLAGDRRPNRQEQRFAKELQAIAETHGTIDAVLDHARKLDRRVQSAGPVASSYKTLSSTVVSVLEQAAGDEASEEAMGSDERTVAIISGTVGGFMAGFTLSGGNFFAAIFGGVGIGLAVAATTEDEGSGSGESEEGASDEEGDGERDTGGEDTGGGGDTGG